MEFGIKISLAIHAKHELIRGEFNKVYVKLQNETQQALPR